MTWSKSEAAPSLGVFTCCAQAPKFQQRTTKNIWKCRMGVSLMPQWQCYDHLLPDPRLKCQQNKQRNILNIIWPVFLYAKESLEDMNRSQTSRLDKSVLLSIPFLKKYFRKLTFMLNAQRETKSTRISLANTVHKLWLRFRQAHDDRVASNLSVTVGSLRD
jgi:hypothetical protein